MHNSKKSLLEQEKEKAYPYLNVTGPGDYEAKNLTGISLLESNRKNAP